MEQLRGLIFPLAFLAFFYMILVRPQQKRQKEVSRMRDNLKIGDEITTIGGISGTVAQLREGSVMIEIAPDDVRLTIEKWAIGKVKENKTEIE
ncbi:preprotein translocase subunit YajC [Peptoclostridium litorale DSM 5388]|uniref:Preprotein translocase subunit YajC n=1 Tax=Peptoclostridium litorale DSM 5388 TaxID=1121324 RepID=A0A069RGD0_PEPLI|nr:preprotein translocase subunit YajC [Peptoclostridium litorale]KDR96084.1 hypothetical protein CLIT_5c00960 [Peptoclostridium litorale DSM 5388]SIO05040.1 preprotein translocase subunit YajC [Peptoclostridium litorale DSM 5388]